MRWKEEKEERKRRRPNDLNSKNSRTNHVIMEKQTLRTYLTFSVISIRNQTWLVRRVRPMGEETSTGQHELPLDDNRAGGGGWET